MSDLSEPAESLAARERALEERIAAVTARERALITTSVQRKRELDERERTLEERERELEEQEQALAEPAVPAAAAPSAQGAWSLDDLARLVAARPGDARAPEWQAYLFHLREHADAEGRIPAAFDALVEDAFAPLLGRA